MKDILNESQYADELRRQYAMSCEKCGCQWSSFLRDAGDRCEDGDTNGISCQGFVY